MRLFPLFYQILTTFRYVSLTKNEKVMSQLFAEKHAENLKDDRRKFANVCSGASMYFAAIKKYCETVINCLSLLQTAR